jgi:L-fuconolactonase
MIPTIDAHQHFWRLGQFDDRWLDDPKRKPIRHDFLPQHLLPNLKAAGIERSIVVQTQHKLAENSWALRMVRQNSFIAGIVGWVDLASKECEEQIIQLRDHAEFVGVRHVTHDEPDDDFLLRDDVLRGLKALEKHCMPFDLLLFVKHLKHATTLARRFPELPLVIDHAAKPRVASQSVDDWLEPFRAPARGENFFFKL